MDKTVRRVIFYEYLAYLSLVAAMEEIQRPFDFTALFCTRSSSTLSSFFEELPEELVERLADAPAEPDAEF